MRYLSLRVAYSRFTKCPTGSAYPLENITSVQHSNTAALAQHLAELACSDLDDILPELPSGTGMLSTRQGPGH